MKQLNLFKDKSDWSFEFHLHMCYGDINYLKDSMQKSINRYINCENKTIKVIERINIMSNIIKQCNDKLD